MYDLKRRTFNVDELIPYLFMLTPILTALLVLLLWVVTDAGQSWHGYKRIFGTGIMPVRLDETDVAVLKSLMEDGRKFFRAISREISVSTPTVKARYERLVNMGVIKAVKPEIDVSKIAGPEKAHFKSAGAKKNVRLEGLKVKIKCEFCGGPIHGAPKVLRFAGIEPFFCCTSCGTTTGKNTPAGYSRWSKNTGSRKGRLGSRRRQLHSLFLGPSAVAGLFGYAVDRAERKDVPYAFGLHLRCH